jgi:hypothetical protein
MSNNQPNEVDRLRAENAEFRRRLKDAKEELWKYNQHFFDRHGRKNNWIETVRLDLTVGIPL